MTSKTVACLAGDGVGPELMAAATRALERVSKLHQLELDDRHLPFAGEKADLHLAWRVARVQLPSGGDIVVVGPVGEWADDIAISRAFSCAGSRHGRIVCVGESAAWRSAVAAQTARWGGLDVEEVRFGEVLVRLRDEPE